jgi:ubiquitin C-terminal hydrolase
VAHAAECEYELVGVLCHQGEATAGHYYSYIRDRATGQWNEFNDSVRGGALGARVCRDWAVK